MRKPVRKRRGYDEGGEVNEPDTAGLPGIQRNIGPMIRRQGGVFTPSQLQALSKASRAVAAREENQSGGSNEDAAKYPGFRKGGKVKKVTPVVRKRR